MWDRHVLYSKLSVSESQSGRVLQIVGMARNETDSFLVKTCLSHVANDTRQGEVSKDA